MTAPPMKTAEDRLVMAMAGVSRDPLGFVLLAFPWRETNTILEKEDGPDQWQRAVLNAIKDGLITVQDAIRIAVASGHGIGKSALVAWLILWALCTKPDTRGVVTANTMPQLMTKTWPELAKWYNLLICKHWFQLSATRIHSLSRPETWRVDAVPWNETNTEAFAGLHNQGRRILVIYDEASAIDDKIWETTEGALTDANTEIIWCVFGNPTRNTGRFRECFGRLAHRWRRLQIDSRSVRITNKQQISQWISDYGEDSDFVRVRVRGVFPRAGTMQFIPLDVAEAAMAMAREVSATVHDALAIGVDVARFGDDKTVIRFRRGRDARSMAPIKMRGADTTTIASTVNNIILSRQPQGVFVDAGGVGGGVVDQLRAFGHRNVYGIDFGTKPLNAFIKDEGMVVYANRRAEMWGILRDWLSFGMIDNDPELLNDLTGIEYGFTLKDGRDAILLEKKEDMKKRGLASPDDGDALALTFAVPLPQGDFRRQIMNKPKYQFEYQPLAEALTLGSRQQPMRRPAWWPGQNIH